MPNSPPPPIPDGIYRYFAAFIDQLYLAYIGFAILSALTPWLGGQDLYSQLIVVLLGAYFVLNYHGPGHGAKSWASPGEQIMGWAVKYGEKIRRNPFNRSRLPIYWLTLATLISGIFLFVGLGAGLIYTGVGLLYVIGGAFCLLLGIWAFFSQWMVLSFATIIGLYCAIAALPFSENAGIAVWGTKIILMLQMAAWVVAYFIYSRSQKPKNDVIGFVLEREVEIEATYRERFVPVEEPFVPDTEEFGSGFESESESESESNSDDSSSSADSSTE